VVGVTQTATAHLRVVIQATLTSRVATYQGWPLHFLFLSIFFLYI
jgi:hypothetical protein